MQKAHNVFHVAKLMKIIEKRRKHCFFVLFFNENK